MKVESLRQRIKDKFGTIANFCRVANINDYELRSLFMAASYLPKGELSTEAKERAKELIKISKLVTETEPEPEQVTDEELRKAIKGIQNMGIEHFCEANKTMNKGNLKRFLAGQRRKKTPAVRKILEILGVK